jgi:hypothetical protein
MSFRSPQVLDPSAPSSALHSPFNRQSPRTVSPEDSCEIRLVIPTVQAASDSGHPSLEAREQPAGCGQDGGAGGGDLVEMTDADSGTCQKYA